MNIQNKVVLVTGASEGIGKATALLLAQRGAKVAIAARSLAKLETITQSMSDGLAIQADITNPDAVAAMVNQTVRHFGRIDALINNAGRAMMASTAEIAIEEFDEIMRLNLYGPLLAMQAVIPHMRKNAEGGAIVNVSSMASKMTIPTIGAYAASKAALNVLTQTAREELAADGITVSLMYPSRTDTSFNNHAITRTPKRYTGPSLHASTPEHVAEKIAELLASGAAEQYMEKPQA